MEKRKLENTPRAGTSTTGESRTPGSPGVCRTYTGAAPTACEGKGAVATAKEGEGATTRECPKPAHLTAPAADAITDEDVDFSVYQPNGVERVKRLAQRKKERGCPIRDLPDLPPALQYRDVLGTQPRAPTPTGHDEEERRELTRSPRVVLRDVMREFSLPPPQGRDDTGDDSEDWPLDSDDMTSDVSMDSEGLPTDPDRTRRKRRISEDDKAPPLGRGAVPKAKKGRGRPPTTGQYVGFGKAQAELNKEKEEERRAAFRAKVEEVARRAREEREAREARASLRASPTPTAEDTEQTSAALAGSVERALEMVTMVATRSSNLKGTYQRALKEAVASIKAAVTEMRGRGQTEEMRALEAQNDRLLRQVNAMRRELEELRHRVTGPAADDLQKMLSEVSRSNIETFGNMLNARIAGLEDRLLPEPRRRPPLVADSAGPSPDAPPTAIQKKTPKPKKTATAMAPDKGSAGGAAAPLQPPAATTEKRAAKPKKKRKKRPSMAAQEAAKGGQNTNAPPAEAPWTTVDPRRPKQKKKGAATPAKAAPKNKKKKKAKLRAPNTAAITVTLKASAAEKGVTYKDVLLKAKDAVGSEVQELGINRVGFRFRLAQTGARVLTIPGEGANEKADALAAKMREALDPEVVTIGRPAKCVEMRIAGLDDSTTTADVLEAVAREGGCPTISIRSGPIKKGRWGDGSLWLSVPVAAAKKLLSLGRLRVGWVSAKAAECREKHPNCFFCEALGKEKDHVLGSSGCVTAKPLPSTKRRKRRGAPSDKARPKEPGAGGAGVSQPQPAMEVEP
ncbi:actin cytoskeleton-regulatory complex protein PAN1-like [Aricia agestis]|uniref:actin cytoskeleton-regulatory complex protein PAN1-like n=1 Tax=Aricia agestis TaxID=91739 RepID=UPI001C202A7B|nr:actin cytoskeleton-regulatory complex protein PAN1-like [Aricia agestis]XP_041980951.1 actin cytoskeleton-regulatory complex protein PAN1-like [Aricia agestis]